MLSYNFKELKNELIKIEKILLNNNKRVKGLINEILKQREFENFEIITIEMYRKNDSDRIIVNIKIDNQYEEVELEYEKINSCLDLVDLDNLKAAIRNANEIWNSFRFKTKEDIRDFIAEYYGGYQ
ncbi:hypothetical protein HIR57_09230 [Staphylococcus coagulans]|uniref:hypothetical protein n=1 Tax=Staphylococcus coagulans TaxID=74706 RepID=UPI001BE4E91A|nr:hypothetical protein [Staphylococcus coagulans]MBT2814939.1 hypothetical protein [Staphylococcus coagulans]MBT2817343.1 hypothetical protein [Staphylococcus coagulans]MBT2838035.1 hypothetical protein [Staphylococcus coagulans]MBT2842577.1 hypothetical protein [Staphylococcus coagulans]MBT2849167.1 hypothetical protein [Staphylococcus coagulans]